MASDLKGVTDTLARILIDLANLTMRQDQLKEMRDRALMELRESIEYNKQQIDRNKGVALPDGAEIIHPPLVPLEILVINMKA